ncbi:hypothetical protein ACFLUP_01075 [Chloroflexota bacterium]
MKKPVKLLLGIFSLIPIIWLAFTIYFAASILFTGNGLDSGVEILIALTAVLFTLLAGLIIISVFIILYIFMVFRNKQFDGRTKTFWFLMILVFHWVSIPVYWYKYIWNNPP